MPRVVTIGRLPTTNSLPSNFDNIRERLAIPEEVTTGRALRFWFYAVGFYRRWDYNRFPNFKVTLVYTDYKRWLYDTRYISYTEKRAT